MKIESVQSLFLMFMHEANFNKSPLLFENGNNHLRQNSKHDHINYAMKWFSIAAPKSGKTDTEMFEKLALSEFENHQHRTIFTYLKSTVFGISDLTTRRIIVENILCFSIIFNHLNPKHAAEMIVYFLPKIRTS
jgi:hypothetical protein